MLMGHAGRQRTSTVSSDLFTSSDDDYERDEAVGIDEFLSRIDINMVPSEEICSAGQSKGNLESLIDLEGEAAKEPGDELTEERRWIKRFSEPDGPESIVFDEKEPTVILAATREKLLAALTTDHGTIPLHLHLATFIDDEMLDEFFMTFRLFMEPSELARMTGFRLRMAYMVESMENQQIRLMYICIRVPSLMR